MRSNIGPSPELEGVSRGMLLTLAIMLAMALTATVVALPAGAAEPTPDPEQRPIATEESPADQGKPSGQVQGITVPAIQFTKTVGLDSNVCATNSSILVDRGTQVYYCFEVTNTGTVTLTQHDLVDDQLGTLLSAFAFDLTPGTSIYLTSTAYLTEAVRNEATWTAYNPGPADMTTDDDMADVFIGAEWGTLVAGTGAFGGSAANPTFEVSVEVTNSAASLFSGFAVGGATYDQAAKRVLFTSSNDSGSGANDYAELWAWPISGGFPTPVGVISATSGTLRIDGLAISEGNLYGAHQFNDSEGMAGIYQIDWTTLQATLVITTPHGGISGIDADPNTGRVYGVNDNDGYLVEIDFTAGITNVVAYPATETDIDGLAIDNHGMAYLIPDDEDPGEIFVYNLETGTYETSLAAPWTTTDTFSGGAFIYEFNTFLPLAIK